MAAVLRAVLLAAYDVKETLARGENPLGRYVGAGAYRGMSPVRDWIDWLGGYPFEVARPEVVVRFCRESGFVVDRLTTGQGAGCNEFVFTRADLAMYSVKRRGGNQVCVYQESKARFPGSSGEARSS